MAESCGGRRALGKFRRGGPPRAGPVYCAGTRARGEHAEAPLANPENPLAHATPDFRSRDSLAAERNKQPIAAVLARVLPSRGLVLEVASGTGQHAEHFAQALPSVTWQPSEPEPQARALLETRVAALALPNLRSPLAFDVHEPQAPLERADALVCINMIHIAPWSACLALMDHARTLLAPGAPLVLYGPFMRDGAHTAASNAAFDASLRKRNAAWGVRDLVAVDAAARERGFELAETVAMPANNFAVVWHRSHPTTASVSR